VDNFQSATAGTSTLQSEGAGLNLRPLPNKLGHNGPYIGGSEKPVARDCARIEGHTHLFRDLERFEVDLRAAIEDVWDGMRFVKVLRAREEPDLKEIAGAAIDTLDAAFQFMQEAYLVAEVLDDRARLRESRAADKSFVQLVATTPPEAMSPWERLAEEGRLTWQISTLLDRMNHVCHRERREWPKIDREDLERFNARLEALMKPSPDAFQAMTDDELGAELQRLEGMIAATRKAITLILAIRTVRRG
jgi:hypothetical protein